MYLFGGQSSSQFPKQISVLESCDLRRIGDLPTKFFEGACNTFDSGPGDEHILLCFGFDEDKDCYR